MVHQWTERLVEQEIRIGILRLSRIGENKIYRLFRYRVIDDRKKAPWQFCVGDRSLFVETASFRTQREQSSGNCRLPLVIQNQYSACQAAEVLAFFAFAAELRPRHRASVHTHGLRRLSGQWITMKFALRLQRL